jgi:FkbM family methyltransferase
VGPEGRVVAVEPDPGNLRLLRANLEANDCHNVIVLPFALGETTGAAQLYVNEVNCGASSLAKPRDDSPSITVTIRRGEEVLKELGLQPSVAKIDVEGAEPAVFRGLGYSPSVLLMEFDSTLLAAHGEDPAQFLHFLLARGYSLEVIDSKSGKCVASTPAEIIAATDQRPVTVHNILAHT